MLVHLKQRTFQTKFSEVFCETGCYQSHVVCVSSALASRCLQLVVHYIPVIRAHFETRLQPKQYSILRHFGHITKVDKRTSTKHSATRANSCSYPLFLSLQDYNDHIAEIWAKLVAIMDSMFEKALSKVGLHLCDLSDVCVVYHGWSVFVLCSMRWRRRCRLRVCVTCVNRWPKCTRPFMNSYRRSRRR